MNRFWLIAFLAMVIVAAGAPALRQLRANEPPPSGPASQWPHVFEGRALTPIPLAREDAFFAKGFPGALARFSDGARHIVIRHVTAPTRQLHPASHCFRGAGYAIKPLPLMTAVDGAGAACFTAAQGQTNLRVCEFIEDDTGRRWHDVSVWYWAALNAPRERFWRAYVVVESSPAIPSPAERQ
jgi:hypothetical protein